MAQQEYYLGSVGPLLYDDTETYPDTVGRVAVRGVQMYVSDAPSMDNHVLRKIDMPEFDASAAERGDIWYFNGTIWTMLHHGVDGQVLTTKGHGADPEWADPQILTEGTLELIERIDSGSNGTAYFRFDLIPQIYSHLILNCVGLARNYRGVVSGMFGGIGLFFNGEATTNRASNSLLVFGDGAGNEAINKDIYIPGSQIVDPARSGVRIEIPCYSMTGNVKAAIATGSFHGGATVTVYTCKPEFSTAFADDITDPITSLYVKPISHDYFYPGSYVELYGVRDNDDYGGCWELIEEVEALTDMPSIAFSDIPQSYGHMIAIGQIKSDDSDINDTLELSINFEAVGGGATLTAQSMGGFANGATSTFTVPASQGSTLGDISARGVDGDFFSPLRLDFPMYTSSKRKGGFFQVGTRLDDPGTGIYYCKVNSGLWLCSSSAPITELEVYPTSGNVLTGSKISLYGLKETEQKSYAFCFISSTEVTAEAESIEIDLPGDYADILILGQLRGTDASNTTQLNVLCNDDAETVGGQYKNYSVLTMYANGPSEGTRDKITSATPWPFVVAASGPSGQYSPVKIELFGYVTTDRFPQFSVYSGFEAPVGTTQYDHSGFAWCKTETITKLTIKPSSGHWAVGSKLSVYGFRANLTSRQRTSTATALAGLSGVDFSATAEAQGDMIIRSVDAWINVPAQTDGQVWTCRGPGADPEWATPEDAPEASDTVVAETSYGQSSNVGTAGTFSRGDHTHGTPAAPSIPSASDTVEAETSYGALSSAGTSDDYSRADHTHGTPAALYTDGWHADTDTWVYVSATSFKIEGKDVTSRFPVGCKIKVTQTSAKYFYVVSVAFSTDTTVTVTAGSDYSLANAAITSPCYSYQENPVGFPHWFNYTPTWTGFSTPPSGGTVRFRISGRHVFQNVNQTTYGISNANTCTVSLAVAATSRTGYYARSFGYAVDNGVGEAINARTSIGSGATTATLCRNNSATGWTTTGNKDWMGQLDWEI